MPQSAAITALRAPERHADPHAVLTQTIAALKPFQMYVDICSETDSAESWIGRDELYMPDSAPLSDLIARFTAKGFAPNKRAASASLLLRIGWAGGLQIASYLVCRRVPYLRDYALRFGAHTGLNGLFVKEARFVEQGLDTDASALREHLLQSLVEAKALLALQLALCGLHRTAQIEAQTGFGRALPLLGIELGQ